MNGREWEWKSEESGVMDNKTYHFLPLAFKIAALHLRANSYHTYDLHGIMYIYEFNEGMNYDDKCYVRGRCYHWAGKGCAVSTFNQV